MPRAAEDALRRVMHTGAGVCIIDIADAIVIDAQAAQRLVELGS